MKNLLMLFSFVMMAGMVSAQEVAAKKSCAKTCTKAEQAACAKTCTAAEKAACAKLGIKCTSKAVGTAALAEVTQESEANGSNVLSASAVAELLAETDESISRKECPMSGKISYFRKSECSKTGKVSMEEVKYCSKSEAFVNASPSDMAKEASAKVIKTADTVDGKVQSASASKGKKKACCAGKKKCGSKKTGV